MCTTSSTIRFLPDSHLHTRSLRGEGKYERSADLSPHLFPLIVKTCLVPLNVHSSLSSSEILMVFLITILLNYTLICRSISGDASLFPGTHTCTAITHSLTCSHKTHTDRDTESCGMDEEVGVGRRERLNQEAGDAAPCGRCKTDRPEG